MTIEKIIKEMANNGVLLSNLMTMIAAAPDADFLNEEEGLLSSEMKLIGGTWNHSEFYLQQQSKILFRRAHFYEQYFDFSSLYNYTIEELNERQLHHEYADYKSWIDVAMISIIDKEVAHRKNGKSNE